MSTLTKSFIAFGVVAGIFGLAAFFGFSPYGKEIVQQIAGTSTAGGTFNNAKFAGIAVSPADVGSNATTSSLYNADANDRYIVRTNVGCENVGTSKTAYTGAGLSALTLTIATSSAANPATGGDMSANTLTAITIGTSTAFFAMSSSTTGVNGAVGTNKISNIWAAGTYLSGQFNATNTAACTWGVDYTPS